MISIRSARDSIPEAGLSAGAAQTQVLDSPGSDAAAARGAIEESDLHQVRLVKLFDGVPLLAQGRGDGIDADRTPVELFLDRQQYLPVEAVEPVAIHLQTLQVALGDDIGDRSILFDLGEVSDPSEEPIGDARRAPGAAGYLL